MIDWLKQNRAPSKPSRRGPSDLTDTLLAIARAMRPARPGDAIYLITSNSDPLFAPEGSKEVPTGAQELKAELQSSGVRLLVLALEVVPDAKWNIVQPDGDMATIPFIPAGTASLAGVVRGSGGLSLDWYPTSKSVSFGPSFDYNAPAQAAIRASARGFQNAISNFYVLTVALTERSSALEDWNLEVVDSNGKMLKGVALAYPHKIRGCAP